MLRCDCYLSFFYSLSKLFEEIVLFNGRKFSKYEARLKLFLKSPNFILCFCLISIYSDSKVMKLWEILALRNSTRISTNWENINCT
jgi:hypothetical protein